MSEPKPSGPEAQFTLDVARNAGRDKERTRVLDILSLCDPAVPAPILRAIAGGTPADRVRRMLSGDSEDVSAPSSEAPSAPKAASKWASVTQRLNERQRAKAAASTTAEAES